MSALAQDLGRVALIGVGATALMDLWLLVLKRLRIPTLDFALVGRWVGHLARGRWSHPAIANAPRVRGEVALGWITHYASGVAFAGLLVLLAGMEWTRHPSLAPALLVGIGTVLVPLFVMQPAMGAGFASSKTPTPWRNRGRSVLTHAIFGAGLYIAALAIEWSAR
jgi:hypothetical protein